MSTSKEEEEKVYDLSDACDGNHDSVDGFCKLIDTKKGTPNTLFISWDYNEDGSYKNGSLRLMFGEYCVVDVTIDITTNRCYKVKLHTIIDPSYSIAFTPYLSYNPLAEFCNKHSLNLGIIHYYDNGYFKADVVAEQGLWKMGYTDVAGVFARLMEFGWPEVEL